MPYLIGGLAAASVLVAACLAGWTLNIFTIFKGADGRPSTSQFQFWLWTLAVVFAYVALYVARASKGVLSAIDYIPVNVLLAMGFSVTTAAGAKAITVSYLNSGSITKPPLQSPATAPINPIEGVLQLRYLLTDDNGNASLVKIQMVFWTALAVVIYTRLSMQLVSSIEALTSADFVTALGKAPRDFGLPDIGSALMVLMGVSQGAYLGLKLGTVSSPSLTSIDRSTVQPGTAVTLSGRNLGSADGSGALLVDDATAQLTGQTDWSDTRIKAVLDPAWDGIPAGPALLSVATGGQQSNSLPIILPPKLNNISTNELQTGASFSLYGTGLGDTNSGTILIRGQPAPQTILRWSASQIDAVLNAWAGGPTGQVDIVVSVAGLNSNPITIQLK